MGVSAQDSVSDAGPRIEGSGIKPKTTAPYRLRSPTLRATPKQPRECCAADRFSGSDHDEGITAFRHSLRI